MYKNNKNEKNMSHKECLYEMDLNYIINLGLYLHVHLVWFRKYLNILIRLKSLL